MPFRSGIDASNFPAISITMAEVYGWVFSSAHSSFLYLFDFSFIYVTAAPLPGFLRVSICAGKVMYPVWKIFKSRQHRVPRMFTIQHTFRSVVVFVAATIDRNLLNILTPSNRPRSVKRNASPAYCAPSERVLRVLLLFCSASRSVCYSNRSRLREPRLRLTLMDPNLFKFSVGERFSHDDFGAIRCTWASVTQCRFECGNFLIDSAAV